MRLMVIDPRGRLRRSRFLWVLILPNIGAGLAIIALRIMDTPAADIGIGAILVLLLWSANFAAPIARLHDLGLPALVHFIVLAAGFLLGTVGPVGSFDELTMRLKDWMNVVRGGDSAVPPITGESARVAALIALVQVFVLSFVPGKRGPNRFGPDPKDRS